MTDGVVGDREYLRTVLDAIPAPLFVIDADLRVQDLNRAAAAWTGGSERVLRKRLCGEAIRCANTLESGQPCGETDACPKCAVRLAVRQVGEGESTVRRRTRMRLIDESGIAQFVSLLVTAAPFEHGQGDYALVILEDITELTDLRRLLPVCANCRKVRNDDLLWESVEAYLARHTNIELTHGLCPDCRRKLYPDLE